MLVVSEEKDKRLAAIKDLVTKISAAKIKLKEAMIADDSKATDEQKKSIEKMQSDLKWNVDAPLDRQTLNIFDLKDGKFGVISDPRVKIFQILEKENGSVLASVLEGPNKVTFRAVGLNPKNLVTDMYFPKEPFFVVDGTYSYETVGGESKTIYVLYAVSVPPIFTEAESIKLGLSATADFAKVELTSEEQSTLQQNREAAKLKVEQKELATKLRQAKSYLDSGKVLMKRDIKAGAKKQFEKAISTAPDSDTAKEAKKLLDSIP